MNEENMSSLLESASTTERNISHSPGAITPANVAIACFILLSFLVGLAVNGLLLWVLGVKMERSVSSFWFFHLILSYLICCFCLPFYAVKYLLDSKWVFGQVMCKLTSFFFGLGMYSTVFLLTIISLDRYVLICHPIWSQHNRTICWVKKLLTGMWLVSFILLTPALFFLETRQENNITICVSNYALSSDWKRAEIQDLRNRVHLVFFLLQFLLVFLLPFVVIMTSYCWIVQEMKKKRLARTGKPYRVLVAAVASFFICRFPFHLYELSLLLSVDSTFQEFLQILFIIGTCCNICFTPILYLFVGEKFQQVFKTSVVALLEKGFTDFPMSVSLSSTQFSKEHHQSSGRNNFELTLTPGNELPGSKNAPLCHV